MNAKTTNNNNINGLPVALLSIWTLTHPFSGVTGSTGLVPLLVPLTILTSALAFTLPAISKKTVATFVTFATLVALHTIVKLALSPEPKRPE